MNQLSANDLGPACLSAIKAASQECTEALRFLNESKQAIEIPDMKIIVQQMQHALDGLEVVGGIDLASIIRNSMFALEQVTAETAEAADENLEMTYTGEAENGRVLVTTTRESEIIDVTIHTLAKRRLDNYSLGDAVVAAARAAQSSSEQAQRDLFNRLPLGELSLERFLTDPESFVPRLSEGKLGPAFDSLTEGR